MYRMACGLPSFFVYSFYFWNKDKQQGYLGITDWEAYRRQHFQEVIYALNHPNTRVIQSAFTNFSIMDHEYLTQLFGARKFPDGRYVIDYIDDIVQHQKVFLEVVSKIRETQMFTFPVLTYSLLYQDGKFVDEDFAKWCCKHNMEWGDSNFFVGSDVTTLSNCCRLLSDTSKLDPFINSIGGTSLSVGSIKVNTINLRRISLESGGDKERFMQILDERVQLCMKALDIIRDILKSNISKGLLPTYEYEMIDMQKQYSTIGITAMYEVVNDFGGIATDAYGNKSYTDDGIEFASRIMKRINEIKNRDADKFGCKFNIEAIPAESANIKLCEKDHLLFKDKVQEYIYSNQWIGMGYTATLAERVRLGSILDKECNGGQIAHVSIDGKFTSFEQAWTMLNEIASRGCIYFAFNYKINTCANNHSFVGGTTCPNCGKPVENTWTRIVGFYTPVKAWSPKRREEFDERKWYTLTDDGIF